MGHRKLNNNVKRYAVASALAASAIPSLVMSRGHIIEKVPELPLVLDESVESVSKTSKALAIITAVGARAEIKKTNATRQIRKGRGKIRNRRHVTRKGPMILFANDYGISR